MSYQPEERYWTDYLRIALPVVGLLLMLGLFWFWAASLIGDEDDDDPSNLAAVATATVPVSSPSPSPPPATEVPGNQAGNVTQTAGDGEDETATTGDNAGDTTDDEDPNAGDAESAGDQTTEDEGNGEETVGCAAGDFCEGVLAVVNSDNVRLRSEPSTEGGDDTVLDLLQEGDEVELLGDPTEGDDGLTWVEVDSDLGEGFVTTDFLDPE